MNSQEFFMKSPKIVHLSFLFLCCHMCAWWWWWCLQAYSSYTVGTLLEQHGACVTADYAAQDDGTISVVNTAR